MTTTDLPLAEITRAAIKVLCRELGVSNTARFLNQYSLGYGNYTVDRADLFNDMTVDDIATEIYRSRKPAQNATEQ